MPQDADLTCGRRRGAQKGDRMARTVIQITADPSYLYALCDDGEIFRLAWISTEANHPNVER
jgi:hypothetical protein